MKRPDLSLWWEQRVNAPYVAVRRFVADPANKLHGPLRQVTVGYCSADFDAAAALLSPCAGIRYLVWGEKEPVQDSSPLSPQEAALVGGLVRPQPVLLVPLLDICIALKTGLLNDATSVQDSDHVPLLHDYNNTVRVISGQYESAKNDIVKIPGVCLLDVVLKQGGTFHWKLPPGANCFIYVVSGKIHLGAPAQKGPVCKLDELIWTDKEDVVARAWCEGGRFLIGSVPAETKIASAKGAYYLKKLSPLQFITKLKNEEAV